MVETWKALWFGENGTRLLAILPRTTVDSVLPLDVSPQPAETKRVFVARLEILTPERESRVAELVKLHHTGNRDAQKELDTLGRFEAAAIKRVNQLAGRPRQ